MNDLRTLLRQHDPASGATLAEPDRHRIRAAMWDGLRHRSPAEAGAPFLRPIVATFMSLLVLITITFGVIRNRRDDVPEPRRVEYTTPGGTRVIWTLDPSFPM